MAKITVGGNFDKYITALSLMDTKAKTYIGKAIFEGADEVADEVRKEIDNLQVGNPKFGYVTESQKKGLQDGLGIAKMRNDQGFLNVKIGMDGYNSTVTKKYPKGQPNALIARSLEKGTSWSQKNPFITRAVNRSQAKAEKRMSDKLDEEIKKIMPTV